jgi:galactokinase
MVGAGFGGCTVSLVRRDKMDSVVEKICKRYGRILGHDPWYHLVEASDAVKEIQLQ